MLRMMTPMHFARVLWVCNQARAAADWFMRRVAGTVTCDPSHITTGWRGRFHQRLRHPGGPGALTRPFAASVSQEQGPELRTAGQLAVSVRSFYRWITVHALVTLALAHGWPS